MFCGGRAAKMDSEDPRGRCSGRVTSDKSWSVMRHVSDLERPSLQVAAIHQAHITGLASHGQPTDSAFNFPYFTIDFS